MSVENRDLRCYVTQVGFNQEALDKQLRRSTDLTHLVIDGTLLPDGSSPSALTGVQNEVKRYQLSRVEVDAQNASMLIAEAVIPADDGGFNINGIGIETSLGVLYAYARGTGDYKPLLESGQGSDLVVRVQFLPGNADQITLQVDPTAVLATVAYVDQRTQQATEVVAGVAKVATQAMVDAGADDSALVTAKKLKGWVKLATESVLGLMKVATQAQTDAGTDDTVAVTPKKLRWGFSILLSSSGYIVFPSWMGGLIIQWAAWTKPVASSAEILVSLPITFPNQALALWSGAVNGVFPLHQGIVSLSQVVVGKTSGADGYWTNIQNSGINGKVFVIGH